MENINTTTVTGNLTADPELRETAGGTAVCNLRIAVNSRRKDNEGNWVDKPNYFNVVVFGGRARTCAEYLAKGRPVAVTGRLDWSEWTDKEGVKRQKVEIIGDTIQFLNSRSDQGGGQNQPAPASDVPAAAPAATVPAGGAVSDDDIPF